MQYFVSAIGTDSGKTLVSAILAEALKADYWKPVQAGFPRDTDTVMSLVDNTDSRFHPEAYLLQNPMSPHAAAKIEGVNLSISSMVIPNVDKPLVIEGAGGLMVPLNDKDFIIDLPNTWNIPVVLVANLYLGSINHTLLSVDCLKNKGVNVKGIVFNGPSNQESEEIILEYSSYPLLLRVPQLEEVNKDTVSTLAYELLKNWNE